MSTDISATPAVAHPLRATLVVGALGVVFGDLGTSPIYTVQTVFDPHDPHPIAPTVDNVYGVVSLIFWSVMIIVTVTYVLLAMRADNDAASTDLVSILHSYAAGGGSRPAEAEGLPV